MTRFSKWQIVAGIMVAAVIAVLGAFYLRALGELSHYKEETAACRADFSVRLEAEKKRQREDLEQKYSADRISCEVLARRLEAQRIKSQPVAADKK